jgi:hypothetical protein
VDTELKIRVEALESQLCRWKIITVMALIAMTALVVSAASPPQDNGFVQQFAAPKFAAQTFLLVGKDGKTYARLSIKRDQPIFEFYDSKGAVIWSAPPSIGGFKPVQAQ